VRWVISQAIGGEAMQRVLDFLQQRKTYIAMGVTFALAGCQAIGYPIPAWVYVILGALGITFVKAGQNRIENTLGGSSS
jgi:hypothetical protein